MAQDIENKVKTETPDGAASKKAAPATSTTLNDDTKVSVKSLAPAVYYTCTTTFESFAWVEVGDVQEMTYKQLRMMKAKHPSYFSDKWLLPMDKNVVKKLGLDNVYSNSMNRGDMRKLYGSDVKEVDELLSGLSNEAKTGLAHKVEDAVKNGKIENVKIIRCLEKHLGVELMQYV